MKEIVCNFPYSSGKAILLDVSQNHIPIFQCYFQNHPSNQYFQISIWQNEILLCTSSVSISVISNLKFWGCRSIFDWIRLHFQKIELQISDQILKHCNFVTYYISCQYLMESDIYVKMTYLRWFSLGFDLHPFKCHFCCKGLFIWE